jgi:type II secretory pathway pseudopilin PulG
MEIDAKTQQMADFMKMYENPAVRFGFTILEVLPVGILVSLITAALLRRKEVVPL